MDRLSTLSSVRDAVSRRFITAEDEINYYTDIIDDFMASFEKIVVESKHSEISSVLSGYVDLISAKEKAGIERAWMSSIVAMNDPIRAPELDAWMTAWKKQEELLNNFEYLAPDTVIDFYNTLLQQPVFGHVSQIRTRLLEQSSIGNYGYEESYVWATATKRMHLLKDIEDLYSWCISNIANSVSSQAKTAILTNGLLGTIALLIVVTFSLRLGRKMTRGVSILVDRAKLISGGEYPREEKEWIQDAEFSVIDTALRNISSSFQSVVDQANIIADGDFSGRINPRSEKDELALAFNKMTGYLNDTTGKLKNIYQSMTDVLLVISPDAIIQSVNSVGCLLTGYSEKDLIGMSIGKVLEEEEEEEEVFTKQILSLVQGKIQAVYDRDPEDFWSLLKTGPLGVVVVDSKGRILSANEKLGSLFGYTTDELTGKPIHMLLPPDLIEIHEIHRTGYMDSPDPRMMGRNRILKAQKKDGTTFRLEVGLMPMQVNEDTCIVTVVHDPASRKQWEFIRHTRFGRLFAEEEEEEEEEVFQNEDRILVSNKGKRIPVLMSGSIMRDDAGIIQGAVLVAKDITRRVETQKELEVALEKAQEGERMKTLFMANMSHEIRTPLNSILGFTGLIKDSTKHLVSAEEQEFFETIQYSGERLMRTVHEILDISQIEAGTYDFRIEKLDLCRVTSSIVNTLKPVAVDKGLQLRYVSNLESAFIEADKNGVSQSISNIIDNAIKYTEGGKITVSLNQKSKHYVLAIQDTGIGIAEEYIDTMFKAFTQESEGYTKKFQGIGLGMAITKQHLDLNDIEIDVKSEKGVGTTFTLTFKPVKKPLKKKEIEQKTTEERTTIETDEKPLVLLVEDDTNSQRLVEFFLRGQYEVCTAVSVGEAKERLKKSSVELVLLDLSLVGNEDGLDLVRWMRKTSTWEKTPVVATTAHAFTKDKENCIVAGCNDYLSKPIQREKLLATINKFV